MFLRTIFVLVASVTIATANTVNLTQGQTCGHSGTNSQGISSFSTDGRTYVCSDQCPRPFLTNNGTAVYNGTSLLTSSFLLGQFPCVPVASSPLISSPGNIGCFLALSNDDVTPVTAWSFYVQVTNENGVLMSTAFGDIILSNRRVRVRSPDGNNEADIGQEIQLSRRTHFTVLIRRAVRTVYVDVYINGVHSGSTTSYAAPFNVGNRFDVTFGGCEFCGVSNQRSLVGQIDDIRKFDEGLTNREVTALFNGTLPEVMPASSCLCPPSHPYDVTNNNMASYACAQAMGTQNTGDLVSRFYDVSNGAYYTDLSFLTDGMTSSLGNDNSLLPAFWLSDAGTVALSVQFPEPSIISKVRLNMLSDLPSDGIRIYKLNSSMLLHVVGDCSQFSSQGAQAVAYEADDITCIDSQNVITGSTVMEWNAMDRPGGSADASVTMTSSAKRHLSAEGVIIELRGSPRSGQARHAITELVVDTRPLTGDLCQCYKQKTKDCSCSCSSLGANEVPTAAVTCEPQIESIYPEVGSLSGNMKVTITGKNMLPQADQVTIGGASCVIQKRDEKSIECITASVTSPMRDQPVKVMLDKGLYFYAKDKFHYINLPQIDDIQPKQLLERSDTLVTIKGRNLDLPGAHFAIEREGQAPSSVACIRQTDTEVVCPTPVANTTGYIPNSEGLYNLGNTLRMGLIWPEIGGLDNVSISHQMGVEGVNPRIYASPDITFKEGTAVFRAYETEEFTFEGKNLENGLVSKDNYTVRVGGKKMEILEITDKTLKIKLPKDKPVAEPEFQRNTMLLAQVQAGATALEPGYIKWFDTIWDDVSARIGILCAVFAVFMVLLVITLTILSRRRSKKQKDKETLLNNNFAEAAPAMTSKSPSEDFAGGGVRATSTEKLINLVDSEYLEKLKMCLITDSNSLTRSGAHVKGNFGEVVHGEFAMNNSASQSVYIKCVRDVSRAGRRSDLESHVAKTDGYLRHAGLLAELVHPNVQAVLGLAFAGQTTYFIYPKCKATDLKFYLRHPDVNCTVGSLLEFVKNIANGMKYLHTHDIIHTDVAARNCVVNDHNAVCISDAVLADDFYPEDYSQPLGGTADKVYPIRWMSPRYLESGNCTFFGDDIYSFAITVWEVITRCQFPYADMTNPAVQEEVPRGMRPDQPHHCPDELFDLMTVCWSPNFKLRPSFEFIVNTLDTFGTGRKTTTDDRVIELTSRSPPEVYHQEVMIPHVTLANSGGAYFNLAFKNDSDVTTNM